MRGLQCTSNNRTGVQLIFVLSWYIAEILEFLDMRLVERGTKASSLWHIMLIHLARMSFDQV